MAFLTGEVVSNPSGLLPYKIVFKRDGVVASEWPVSSIAEGERRSPTRVAVSGMKGEA